MQVHTSVLLLGMTNQSCCGFSNPATSAAVCSDSCSFCRTLTNTHTHTSEVGGVEHHARCNADGTACESVALNWTVINWEMKLLWRLINTYRYTCMHAFHPQHTQVLLPYHQVFPSFQPAVMFRPSSCLLPSSLLTLETQRRGGCGGKLEQTYYPAWLSVCVGLCLLISQPSIHLSIYKKQEADINISL